MLKKALLTTLLFSHKAVATMIHNAVNTNQFHAGVAEMLH